jgi:hypothetical protein
MHRRRALSLCLIGLVCAASAALGHEERLVIGEVQAIDAAHHLLVVRDAERDRSVRLVVDPETEVQRCRRGLPLAALQVGARVRVKYLDRPNRGLEARSILILPAGP